MANVKTQLKPLEINALPRYDDSDNPTNCCPRFEPKGWDDKDLRFRDKLFVRAATKSIMHVPVNMGKVFSKTFKAIEGADAHDSEQTIVMSKELSPWTAEHYFAVIKAVPGQEMDRLSGNFHTKVFEGPYKNAKNWEKAMGALAREFNAENVGNSDPDIYYFYTTCPKCAKAYGKNYVVGLVRT